MKKEKIDPYDGTVFMPKRSNQLFASRENQIAYNNEKARKAKEPKKEIDKAIKKNRQICDELLKGKLNPIIFSKDYLLGKGFNFNFYTMSCWVDKKKSLGIYEFYCKEEDGQLIIGRRDGKY